MLICIFSINYEAKASGKRKENLRYVGILRIEKRFDIVIWDCGKVNMTGSKIVLSGIYLRFWNMRYLLTNLKWDLSVSLSLERNQSFCTCIKNTFEQLMKS